MITIKNGQVYTQGRLVQADMCIEQGKITKIQADLPAQGKVIDATDKIVCHGFIDLHVHLREPGFAHKETVKTGTLAAAAGGFTTICTMPNLNPVPDSVEHVKVQLTAIEKDGLVKVLPFGSITVGQKGEEIADMAGVAPYVCGFSDDGKGVQSRAMMDKVMTKAAALNKLVSAHCEDESLLSGGYIHEGEYAEKYKHKGISAESEYAQIRRDIELAHAHGTAYHVCHISTKEGIDAVRQGKSAGTKVTCEVTPHHIALCDMDIIADDGRFKMNPPLRSDLDREAIINGILDGTIDCIATDHAPHSAEEKAKGLAGSAMGVVGLETAFAACYTVLVAENRLPVEVLLGLLTEGGKILGLEHDLVPGAVADVVVLNTKKQWRVDSGKFHSMGKSTPFDGQVLMGRVENTIVGGKEVYRDGK